LVKGRNPQPAIEVLMNRLSRFAILCLAIAGVAALQAQVPVDTGFVVPAVQPPRPSAQAQGEPIPVRVDIALSRYLGEKRIANLPFTLLVMVDNMGGRAALRVGSQVPTSTGAVMGGSSGGAVPTPTAVTYQRVGTNIDVVVFQKSSGRFSLELRLEDSSVAEPATPSSTAVLRNFPVTKSNSVNTTLLLRDGQPTELVVAADKVSGETIKAEVRVTTIK
jgi:hypothetical protein